MKIYTLHKKQNIPISIEEAWDFLSDPKNLKTITPEYMSFDILSNIDKTMYPGQIIQYIVTPILGIKTKWVTEITHVKDKEYFVDEQRFGPYALWHHKHFIKKIDGGVEMEDIIFWNIQWINILFFGLGEIYALMIITDYLRLYQKIKAYFLFLFSILIFLINYL